MCEVYLRNFFFHFKWISVQNRLLYWEKFSRGPFFADEHIFDFSSEFNFAFFQFFVSKIFWTKLAKNSEIKDIKYFVGIYFCGWNSEFFPENYFSLPSIRNDAYLVLFVSVNISGYLLLKLPQLIGQLEMCSIMKLIVPVHCYDRSGTEYCLQDLGIRNLLSLWYLISQTLNLHSEKQYKK